MNGGGLMKRAIVLTQETCPLCDSQKFFMKVTFKGKYDDKVDFIKKEDNEELFAEWIEKAESQGTPTTIFLDNDEIVNVIIGFSGAKIKEGFEAHFE